jgi:flagellar biosynthesis protein FlhB
MSEKGTEQASPQRKRKARDQGDLPRSRDLLGATATFGGITALGWIAKRLYIAWCWVFVTGLQFASSQKVDDGREWIHFAYSAVWAVGGYLVTILGATFICVLIVGIAQNGGLNLRGNLLQPKIKRFDPATNFRNLFSLRSFMRLLKSLAPVGVLSAFGWISLTKVTFGMPIMSTARIPLAFSVVHALALDGAWILLIWACVDYAAEWRSWNGRLKMSKQEVREEMRDSVGNPVIKGRIRQIQRAMRRRKIKADVSQASVVITNPTHYAVALQFSFETMQAPTVITKGRDLIAKDIREEARWAGVPIIENPPLARSLYRATEPGRTIPIELYSVVAGILAYLYRRDVEQRLSHRKMPAQHRYGMAAQMSGLGGGFEGA